jgi:hypothetical protein
MNAFSSHKKRALKMKREQKTFHELCATGQIEQIRHFCETSVAFDLLEHLGFASFAELLTSGLGRLPVLRYLLEEAPKYGHTPIDATFNNNHLLRKAASNGQQEIVRYLIEKLPTIQAQSVDITASNSVILRHYAERGFYRMCAYLFCEAPKFGQPILALSVLSTSQLQNFESHQPELFKKCQFIVENQELIQQFGFHQIDIVFEAAQQNFNTQLTEKASKSFKI